MFLPGMAEIGAVAEALAPYVAEHRKWVVLPLHSALSMEEQDRVFDAAPPGVRKAILSTNIAETSVTIDGVRFVADSGRAKIMLHDAASRSSALREGWVSQASADQRKGRSGRTGPGVCFRLFSKEEFKAMPLATPPEIMRADLEGLVLQLKQLAGESADPRTFPWLDPPAMDSIEQSVFSLRDAGAGR